MSWSRRALLVTAAAAAAGCGFSPVLAPGGAADGLRGEIEVSAPGNREGYAVTRRLEERLGLPGAARYRLRVTITQGAQVTGIPADRVAARVNLIGQADFVLTDIASGKVVRRGSVQSFTGYSSTSTTAATRAARVDAEDRLMTILADRIVGDLMATSGEWHG
jgi:LPS-assembly lipoprotein